MNIKDAKKNVLIRWVADRMFKGWNTFGIIKKKTKDSITIISFDDFKEISISVNGEAFMYEINKASNDDALNYLITRKNKFILKENNINSRMEIEINAIKSKFQNEKIEINQNLNLIEEAIKNISLI